MIAQIMLAMLVFHWILRVAAEPVRGRQIAQGMRR
jgi:hypothetical protein